MTRAAGTLCLRGNSAPTTNGRSPDPQCLHACRNAFFPPLRNTASQSRRSLSSASSGPEDEPGTAPPGGPPTTVHPHGHAHRVAALSYPPAAASSREISAVLVRLQRAGTVFSAWWRRETPVFALGTRSGATERWGPRVEQAGALCRLSSRSRH